MSLVIPVDPYLERDRWLAERRKGIGASDAAAVLGLSPWASPFTVWLDKTGGDLDAEPPSEAAEWGLLLEPIVRHYFTNRTGLMVVRPAGILRHPEHPWMLASLDGFVLDAQGDEIGVYEGKTANAWVALDWDFDSGRIPDHVVCQVQHQLAVTGLPVAHVAVLVGGQQFRHTTIERDERLIADIIDIESRFWAEHVVTNTPPPIDGHQATTEAVKDLWPQSVDGQEVDLPTEAAALITEYAKASAAAKDAEADKDAAANRLKALLGDAEIGRVDGIRAVSWKSHETANLDRKALRAAHPDICEQFTTRTSTRTFRLLKGHTP